MTTKRTVKYLFWPRDPTWLCFLGIWRFDGTSLSQWLCCPHEADYFDYDELLCPRPHLEWKNLHQEVYREAEGLRLRIHQPDCDCLLPMKTVKSSTLWSVIFFHSRFNMHIWLFTWASFWCALWIVVLCQLWMCPSGTNASVLSFGSWSGDNSANWFCLSSRFQTILTEEMLAVAYSIPFDL